MKNSLSLAVFASLPGEIGPRTQSYKIVVGLARRPLWGHLRTFDLLLLRSDIIHALGAIQFQDRSDMDFPDALLDRGLLLAFERIFILTAAQFALNQHVGTLLERGSKVGQCRRAGPAKIQISTFSNDRQHCF
jgi:hypothetical protein